MPAIHPNSTTLGNIPADINASSSLPTSNTTAVIDDGSIDIPSTIDNITIYDESTGITQEAPISLDLSQDESEISSIEVIVANNTLPTDSDTFIADASLTDAPFLSNITDFSDGVRAGRDLDYFPNKVASIVKNDPVAYIEQNKLSINKFADEMVNHQHQYGLPENLFEPLHKIGEAFAIVYSQNPQKQDLVKRYLQYISGHKNASNIIPANCSNDAFSFATNNATEVISTTSFTTQDPTTDIAQQTTAPTTPDNAFNTTNTTDAIDNTLNNSHETATGFLNSKLFSLGWVSAAHGLTAGVVHGVTGSIYNKFESSGYLKGWRKPAAKAAVILFNAATIATLPVLMLSTAEGDESEHSDLSNKVLKSFAFCFGLEGVNYAAHRTYYYFNKKPMHKESIGNKALEALPLLANTSLLIHGGYNLIEAIVIIGTNTLTAGLSSEVTKKGINYFFNSANKNSEPDVEKNNNIELDETRIDTQFRNILSQVHHDDNETTSNFFIKLDTYFKHRAATGKPININEFYLKNLKQLNEEDPIKAEWAYNYLISEKRLVPVSNKFQISSVIPLAMNKIENWDELTLMQKYAKSYKHEVSFPNTSVTQLKRLIAAFLYGFKLHTTDFQISSTTAKSFKLLSGDLAPPIDMFIISDLGRNPLSIFQPIQIQGNSEETFPIYEMIETLISKESEKNNASNKIVSGKLFPICTETSTAMIEISKPNSPKSKNTIAIHDPENLLKKDLGKIADIAKKHGYSFKNNPDKNYRDFSSPLGAYYFIKNFVKNYTENHMQINMLPNNENPKLLRGLIPTMLSGLTKTVISLKFSEEILSLGEVTTIKRIKKSQGTEKKLDKTATASSEIGLILEQSENQTAIISEQIKRKKEKSITYLSSNELNNSIIGIFTTTLFKDRGDAHSLSTLETISYLLTKRQSDINDTPQIYKDLLPLNDKEGIAIIEMISSKNASKQMLIHDPNHVLENIYDQIFTCAKNHGYICKYNPKKTYSSYWNAKETSQLGAYFFIKNYFHENIAILQITIPPKLKNYFDIRRIILNELTNNLSLVDENELKSIQEINVTDDVKFNLKNYIAEINTIYQIPNNEFFLPASNKTKSYQIILDEIKHYLNIKDNIELSGDSNLEITLWEKEVNFEWSKLFSSKSISVNEKSNQTSPVLFNGIESKQNNEAEIVRFLVSFHSELLVLKNNKELKESQAADERKRRGTKYEKGQGQHENTDTVYELVNNFLDTSKIVNSNNLVALFSKLKSTAKDQLETKIYDEYHKISLKTFITDKVVEITATNQETKLYSANRSSFFNAVPNSPSVAPDLLNHLKPRYK